MTAIGDTREEWRSIPGYEGRYEVSNEGGVRSLPRPGVSGGPIKCCPNRDGYLQISLRQNGRLRVRTVHRLVALAFHGDKQSALHNEVAHLNGDRADNRAANLKWVSRSENISHKRLHGTWQAGENHPRAKLTEADVVRIRSSDETAKNLAASLGISAHTVADVRRGRLWAHVPSSPDRRFP